MALHIEEIIQRMGYANSSCLYHRGDGFSMATFPRPENKVSAHTIKVLNELAPYAVFMVDDEPFVLFFEETTNLDEQKRLSKKIWNAQVPITVSCGPGSINVYDGRSIGSDRLLSLASRIDINEVSEDSPFSYWEITSSNFWQSQSGKFKGDALNEYLLSDLRYITNQLQEQYEIPLLTATKLILRLIFIRYLIDRRVDLDYPHFSSDPERSQEALLDLLQNKEQLYALFSYLKDKFNGNLFELEDEINNERLADNVFQLLADFFSPNLEAKTGQLSFFDLYDFNIIPVELISNIYEILLGEENRQKDSAFYTPQYLVDYILDESITPFIRANGCCKVLDPSCGSGIFLVESYRRMVEHELKGDLFTKDNKLLQTILSNNIFGIDLNGPAIDVAIFSLYLAVLDYKDPKTLKGRFKLPNLRGTNLIECDFFNEETLLFLQKVQFNFIIGNPPWGKGKDQQARYCSERKYQKYLQNDDTCRAFILRSRDFSNSNTQCCFVLHSKLLYMKKAPSRRFREFLLTNTKILRVLELSSVRKLVFKNANAPAVVLSYCFSTEGVLDNRFEYTSMKPNVFFRLFNLVVVEKNDVKYVPQRLLKEYDWAWKTLIYGSSGDIDTILQLKSKFRSIEDILQEESPSLLKGTGVQYNDGDGKDASHLVGLDFLDSDSIDHFLLDITKMSTFQKNEIHRTRDPKLFYAPYCLLLTGLDMSDYTMRSVFSEDDFVFREVIYAIKGDDSQKSFLKNLTGLFNSSIFAYLNLMLGSFAGVEREKRLVDEVLGFPYTYSEVIAASVDQLQKVIDEQTYSMESLSSLKNELNETISNAFQVSDNEFIDYALRIQIPLLTGCNSDDVYRPVNEEDFFAYARYFYDYFTRVFSETGKFISISAYPKVTKYYSAFELTIKNEDSDEWIRVEDSPNENFSAAIQLSYHKINDMFYRLKDFLYFSENSFMIIKPNFYKNWHPALAKSDLGEVIEKAFSDDGGDE